MVRKRNVFEGGWIVASLAYGGLRAALVWAFLREYGVNTLGYVAVEIVSSAMYGLSSARVVGAVVNSSWRRLRAWGPPALLSYVAPDAYILASAGRMPGSILAALVGILAVTVVLSSVAFTIRVRSARRARTPALVV